MVNITLKTDIMNISLYDFKNLPCDDQYNIVLNEGYVMTETIKNDLKFVLYDISSFTVEIVYSKNNRLAAINVFQKVAALLN